MSQFQRQIHSKITQVSDIRCINTNVPLRVRHYREMSSPVTFKRAQKGGIHGRKKVELCCCNRQGIASLDNAKPEIISFKDNTSIHT